MTKNFDISVYKSELPDVGTWNLKRAQIKNTHHKIIGVYFKDGKFLHNGYLLDADEFIIIGDY